MMPTRAAPSTAQSRLPDDPIENATRSPGSIPPASKVPAADAIFGSASAAVSNSTGAREDMVDDATSELPFFFVSRWEPLVPLATSR